MVDREGVAKDREGVVAVGDVRSSKSARADILIRMFNSCARVADARPSRESRSFPWRQGVHRTGTLVSLKLNGGHPFSLCLPVRLSLVLSSSHSANILSRPSRNILLRVPVTCTYLPTYLLCLFPGPASLPPEVIPPAKIGLDLGIRCHRPTKRQIRRTVWRLTSPRVCA